MSRERERKDKSESGRGEMDLLLECSHFKLASKLQAFQAYGRRSAATAGRLRLAGRLGGPVNCDRDSNNLAGALSDSGHVERESERVA